MMVMVVVMVVMMKKEKGIFCKKPGSDDAYEWSNGLCMHILWQYYDDIMTPWWYYDKVDDADDSDEADDAADDAANGLWMQILY